MHPGDESGDHFRVLRGTTRTLSVSFEKGTWATWLYDRLVPHVDELVVRNPGKNALLKDGNKSDRIDASKLAELWRGNQLKPVYHGDTGVRTLRELARSYLTIVKDVTRVMNRRKALYRSWAMSVSRKGCLLYPASSGVAGEDSGSRCPPASGATLSATGQVEDVAAAGTAGTVSGKSQACHHQQATTDSIPGADSIGAGGGSDPESASFPQQAAAVGLQRTGVRDPD